MCYQNYPGLSWSINCYNSQLLHAAVRTSFWLLGIKQTSCSYTFLPFLFFDSSEDISFNEPVESSFSHQVLLFNDTALGSATRSHVKSLVLLSNKVSRMGKKTKLSDFDEGTMLGSMPKKVDNTRQKNINYDRHCWVGSLQCPHNLGL